MSTLSEILNSALSSLSPALARWCQAVAEATEIAQGAAASVWSCPSTVAVNDVVYISGASTVDGARDGAAPDQLLPAIGFVIAKPTPTTCVVQYAGELPTDFVGLVAGTTYYVGLTQGAIVPAGTIFPGGATVQQVGIAKSSTKMFVQIATI